MWPGGRPARNAGNRAGAASVGSTTNDGSTAKGGNGDHDGHGISCAPGELTREALHTDRSLLRAVRERLTRDLGVYAFARRLLDQRRADEAAKAHTHPGDGLDGASASPPSPGASTGAPSGGKAAAASTPSIPMGIPSGLDANDLHGPAADSGAGPGAGGGRSFHAMANDAAAPTGPTREWFDDAHERTRTLRRLAPPRQALNSTSAGHVIVFTHIPKCAGSSFRNQLLLEFVRLHRQREHFACVLYRVPAPPRSNRHGA